MIAYKSSQKVGRFLDRWPLNGCTKERIFVVAAGRTIVGGTIGRTIAQVLDWNAFAALGFIARTKEGLCRMARLPFA